VGGGVWQPLVPLAASLVAARHPHPAPSRRPAVRSRRDAARAEIGRIFGGVIRGRRESTADKPDDMLQAFIDAEYKDGSRCTDDQITGMLLGTLFAGQHTSSISSTWILLNLLHGKHAHYMQRAMAEQVRASLWPAVPTACRLFTRFPPPPLSPSHPSVPGVGAGRQRVRHGLRHQHG